MKINSLLRYGILFATLLSLFVWTGCSGPTGSTGSTGFGKKYKQIIIDMTEQVVVPTYKLLADNSKILLEKVNALAKSPSDKALKEARDAWKAARLAWESTEGFLFGPVDSFGYDPALDSWPVNRTDLKKVLSNKDKLTKTYVKGLSPTQKGFHTIEYLLFGEGSAKKASDLTDREKEYLTATTEQFSEIATALYESWVKEKDGKKAYQEVFKTAGEKGNSTYPSLSSAAQEIVTGMIAILDEVANGKIADPFDGKDTTKVESQFSYNSLSDFINNIRSVQNAYLGSVAETKTSGKGLTVYVKDTDPKLDTEIKAQIQASIDALKKIPEPFRDAITDPSAADKIKAAQAAINKVKTTLENKLLPLVKK